MLAVSLLWRLPSLFEPPWVNDEGTYFAVAQAMAHGYRLYADVWENKPPGVYLLYSAVYHLLGPSLVAVRLAATLAALALVVLTFLIARCYAGAQASLAAGMLAGLLLGVPFLEGTTANAEVFLAALSALGVHLAMGRQRTALAGAALAGAVLFKAVAGFDALALAVWLLLHRRRALPAYACALAATIAAALLLAWAAGILAPMVRDALLYDFGYVGHGNGGGIPWILLLKLGLLALLTLLLRRAPFPFLWLIYAAAGALVSGRFFGHYALQAVVPACVCLAYLFRARRELARRLIVLLPCMFLAMAGLSALAGWALVASGHDSILARRLGWYANVVRAALGLESQAEYRAQIDDHVNRNLKIAAALFSLPPGRLLVWGNTPWVYVLSGRLPATPYTSALRDPAVPGETATLRVAVRFGAPRVVVVIAPPRPPLGSAAGSLERRYHLVNRIENAAIYRSEPSARVTASASSGTR